MYLQVPMPCFKTLRLDALKLWRKFGHIFKAQYSLCFEKKNLACFNFPKLVILLVNSTTLRIMQDYWDKDKRTRQHKTYFALLGWY